MANKGQSRGHPAERVTREQMLAELDRFEAGVLAHYREAFDLPDDLTDEEVMAVALAQSRTPDATH
jgi:hypothetical protein